MKKIIMLCALLFSAQWSLACDQCGCGLLLGVQPYDHANNFGLQWRMRYLQGDIMNEAATDELKVLKHGGDAHANGSEMPASSENTEIYMVLEARGQFWFGQHLSLTASVPLLNNYAAVDNVTETDLYAVGDPLLLGRYVVMGSKSGPDTTRLRHRLTVGFGVKLPLAKRGVTQYGQTLDPDMQPSTGTWDEMASVEYSVRGKVWGTSLSLFGRYNGTASDGFQLGHAVNFKADMFRVIPIKSVQLLPSAGVYVEDLMTDMDNGMSDKTTGGYTVFSDLGMQLWWKDLGFSFAWQQALINDLGSQMVPNKVRLIAGLTFNFDRQ
ncbi:MAG: hypothetical protein ABI373_02850 [Flavobacteriales bacterium]